MPISCGSASSVADGYERFPQATPDEWGSLRPTEVPLGDEDGMPVDCVINLNNVTSLHTALLTDRITVLDSTRMAEVCTALAAATDC